MVDLRGLLSCQTRHIPARTRSNRDKWLFPPLTSLFVGGHPVSGRDRHTLSEDDDMSMAKSVCVVFFLFGIVQYDCSSHHPHWVAVCVPGRERSGGGSRSMTLCDADCTASGASESFVRRDGGHKDKLVVFPVIVCRM